MSVQDRSENNGEQEVRLPRPDLHARLNSISKQNKNISGDVAYASVCWVGLLLVAFVVVWWVSTSEHDLALRLTLASGLLVLTYFSGRQIIRAIQRGITAQYNSLYAETWHAMQATNLALAIADQHIWHPIRERIAGRGLGRWQAPPTLAQLEQQLEFCARHQESLLMLSSAMGRSRWEAHEESGEALSAFPERGCMFGLALLSVGGLYCGCPLLAPLLIWRGIIAGRPLLLRARIAAYADFLNGSADLIRLNGWFCPLRFRVTLKAFGTHDDS